MKKILLILLMLIVPLQAALAAVGNGHGHEQANQATHHEHAVTDHEHSTETPTTHCEGGYHHHHCQAPHLGVLPETRLGMLPTSGLLPNPERHTHFQSFLSNRIERPKWA